MMTIDLVQLAGSSTGRDSKGKPEAGQLKTSFDLALRPIHFSITSLASDRRQQPA